MNLPVKVLVVDDSAFMRRFLVKILESDPDIEVVGYARNGENALKKLPLLKPAVVTLDVEMPGIDGLETLKRIMEEHPVPVLMVSALTEEGAEATISALELGAVDFITKPAKKQDLAKLAQELPEKVKIVSGARIARGRKTTRSFRPSILPRKSRSLRVPSRKGKIDLVAIGTSTGGPSALNKIITSFPADFPAGIVIVQHMPLGFTAPFAKRLDVNSNIQVREAHDGDLVTPGLALIAPSGKHLKLCKHASGGAQVLLMETTRFQTQFRPSADLMLISAAEVYGSRCLGVILTGMGTDGVRGLKAIKEHHGYTLVEDKSSCVVFGMPKSAIEAGVADRVVPLARMSREIIRHVGEFE